MRTPWIGSSALLLLAVGCEKPSHFDLTLSGEQSAVVAAALDSSGRVLSAILCRLEDSVSRCPLAVAGAETIQTWTLSPAQFQADPGLDPLPLRARLSNDPQPPGSCGRCLRRTSSGPQPVHPGDACPMPDQIPAVAWSRSGASRSPDPNAAGQLILDWGGSCPCQTNAVLAGDVCDFDYRRLLPPFPRPRWLDLDATGRTVVVSASAAISIDPSGARNIKALALSLPAANAALLHNGGVVIDARFAEDQNSTLAWFDAQLEPSSIPTMMFSERFAELHAEWLPDTVLAPGRNNAGRSAAVFACDVRNGQCRRITPDGFLPSSTSVIAMVRLDNGSYVGVGAPGLALFQSLPGAIDSGVPPTQDPSDTVTRGTIDRQPFITVDIGRSTPSIETLTLGAVGNRYFICAQLSGQAGFTVFTASVGLDRFNAPSLAHWDPSTDLTMVGTLPPESGCGLFTTVPARPGRIRLLSAPELEFDAVSGTLVSTTALNLELGWPRPIQLARSSSSGWFAALDNSGSIFATLNHSQPRLLYGTAQGALGDHRVVLPDGELFWAFGTHTDPVRVLADGPALTPIDGLTLEDTVTAGTVGADGAFWLAGFGSSGATWIGRLVPDARKLIRLPGLPSDLLITGMVELDPARIIAVASAKQTLWWIDTGSGAALPIQNPANLREGECVPGPGISRAQTWHYGPWTSIDAAFGRAWAVGCGGRTIRVEDRGAGLVATLGPELTDYDLMAVRALCSDHVAIAGATVGKAARNLFELTPSANASDSYEAAKLEIGSPFNWAYQLVGEGSELLMGTSNGVVGARNGRFLSGETLQVPFVLSGASNAKAEFVFGGQGGDLMRFTRAALGTGNGTACTISP